MGPASAPKLTWEEYLDFEETSEVKHEFHDGELLAMVGVTRAHAEIASNLHYGPAQEQLQDLPRRCPPARFVAHPRRTTPSSRASGGRLAGGVPHHGQSVKSFLRGPYALRGHLGHSDCRAYMSDFKVRIDASNRGLYPDLVVNCTSSRDPADRFATETPLIAEILSKSTEAYDRGAKFEYYKQLPSLEQYVLLDSKAVSVDRFRKGPDGRWTMEARLGPGDVLLLESVGLTIPVDELYAQSGVE